MLLTAKQLRKELNITIHNWNYWRKSKKYPFLEEDGTIYCKGNRRQIAVWEREGFKRWWDSRPLSRFFDITKV